MRRSPLVDFLVAAGARSGQRDGVEFVAGFASEAEEYGRVRGSAGVSDASHLRLYRGPVDDVILPLDETLSGNVANLRYGRVLHTLLLDGAGTIRADVQAACGDEEMLVLCETAAPDDLIDALVLRDNPALAPADDLAVLSIDGPRAWAAPRDLFGRDVLGMPYLAIEAYDLDGERVRLIRGGKTAEFGYLLVVPATAAASAWDRLAGIAVREGGGPVGLDVFDALKLDGRFFNVNREGRRVGDPLALGLQWMIDFQKDRFAGREAVLDRRAAGVPRKVLGLALAAGATGLVPGARVSLDGEPAGEVVAASWSGTLGRQMGLALVDRAVAWAGLEFEVEGPGGPLPASSISLPPFVPKSLAVKLDEV